MHADARLAHAPLILQPPIKPAHRQRSRHLRIGHLPKSLLCVPLVAQWLWLAARHRSLTLPSASNPAIETGGLAGEAKSACLAQISPQFHTNVAPWARLDPGSDPVACRQAHNLAYPIIVKPDVGWCGYGVRRIDDDAGLRAYAAAFPQGCGIILQHFVQAPHEAGLAYIRKPGAPTGHLVAMTLRHQPTVTANGASTVAQLIQADPALRRQARLYAEAQGPERLARIPPTGARVVLTTIASLRAGARYEDASHAITPCLERRLDAIARSMDLFHAGRFDVRFKSVAALQAGEFSIIEVNGAGAEAIQFWDNSIPVAAAFRGVFRKQQLLFEIGAQMRRLGYQPTGPLRLAKAWLRQQRLIARYPASN